nr:hypothetical protein 27 [Bacillaceae bacterium]
MFTSLRIYYIIKLQKGGEKVIEDIRNVLVIIATLLGIYKLCLDIAVMKKNKKKRPNRTKGRKK